MPVSANMSAIPGRFFGKKITQFQVRADGNCGLRGIIQSILLQGLLEDKKEEAISFLNALVSRMEEILKSGNAFSSRNKNKKLNKPDTFDNFIQEYRNLTIDRLDQFRQHFLYRDPDRDPLYHENELPTVAKDKLVLYYLAACLRKEMTEIAFAEQEAVSDKAELDTSISPHWITIYARYHKIQLNYKGESSEQIHTVENENPIFTINIVYAEAHFNIFAFEEVLRQRLAIEQARNSASIPVTLSDNSPHSPSENDALPATPKEVIHTKAAEEDRLVSKIEKYSKKLSKKNSQIAQNKATALEAIAKACRDRGMGQHQLQTSLSVAKIVGIKRIINEEKETIRQHRHWSIFNCFFNLISAPVLERRVTSHGLLTELNDYLNAEALRAS